MFASIKTKTIASRNNALFRLVRDLMTGTLTDRTNLDSTYFDTMLSTIAAGNAGTPAWTQVWSDNANAALATACVLTSPSYDTSRTNYLKLSIGTGAGHLNISTGTNQTAGVMENEVFIPTATTGGATNIFNDYVSNKVIFISASNHHLAMTNCFATTYFATTDAIFVAVDMVKDQHARFDSEASMKVGYVSNSAVSLNVSNFYNPRTDLYSGVTPVAVSAYNIQGVYTSVAISRKADMVSNMNLILPVTVNRLSDGWLGENISDLCGIYLTTTTTFADGEIVTIDATKFYAVNPTANRTPANTTRFLIKE